MKKSLVPKKAQMPQSPSKEELEEILRRRFGYDHFRGKQLEAIRSVLSGRDCFCLMPTGGGKSLCYQIPALARDGIVLVVSPLIALMENQVTALKEKAIPAEFLSSVQTTQMREKIYDDLDSGKPFLRLLYVTPELVATCGFKMKLQKLHSRGILTLVAIDEAHCISSWGHDFRPSYRKLESLRSLLQGVPLLALTATAAPEIRTDIIESLKLQNPIVLITSFNRPNIFYEVRYKDLLDDPFLDLSNLIKKNPHDCTIIYCHERSVCDELSAYLVMKGILCASYHAGLNNKTRSAVLQKWVSSSIQVVVATVAFGMGIDRKDVRMVCHFSIPKSMEAFYQESGRCGRDQMPSRSILYFGSDDRRKMEFIISNTKHKEKSRSSSSGHMLRDPLAVFSQMVQYCSDCGCRRKKILECFGEQISASVCQKKCDACKYPDRVSALIAQLGCLQKSSFSSIIFKSASATDEDMGKTEFWNREDEDNFLDVQDDISDSDDGEVSVNAFAKTNTSSRSGINEKIDWLQRAEEKYFQQKEPSKQTNVLPKNSVSDSQRKAIKQRLLDTLRKNQNRLGSLSTDMETAATFLENECFKKYGKVGKSFYNSEAASIIRWISSSSCGEMNIRLQPVSSQAITCPNHDSQETPQTSLISSSKNAVHGVESKNCSDCSRSYDDEERAVPIDLPPIPSFTEFAMQQSQASRSSSTDLKRSPADVLKMLGHREGSEKRVRQNRSFD